MRNIKRSDKDQTRINDQIQAPELRVLDSEGEALGVMSLKDALAQAEAEELDLVEVSPTANPPVARIVDYGKYLYQKEKKLNIDLADPKILDKTKF